VTRPDLDGYLARIGFSATPRVDVETLVEVHRQHLLSIAYENLDVQLGVPVHRDIGSIFRKLVLGRRGGWCYEMNGLLAWALEAIGFSVTRMAAGVRRQERGDVAVGNHLALWVHLEQPYLADVGFGDGMLEPVPIRAGAIRQHGFDYALERLPDGWWRFHNQPRGGAPSFDFATAPAADGVLHRQSTMLQTSPDSPFTQVAVVQRHLPGGLALLRGRILTRLSPAGVERREVADQDDYQSLLSETFNLQVPDVDRLWEKVGRQHLAYLAAGDPHPDVKAASASS
jgi:N-hydroxyarylamine O-acetyltransferase